MNCKLWPNASLYVFFGESVDELYQNGLQREKLIKLRNYVEQNFEYVGESVKKILFYLQEDNGYGNPKIVNLGTGKPKSLIKFAKEEWERLGSKGLILNGKKQYRSTEIMRFVPKL